LRFPPTWRKFLRLQEPEEPSSGASHTGGGPSGLEKPEEHLLRFLSAGGRLRSLSPILLQPIKRGGDQRKRKKRRERGRTSQHGSLLQPAAPLCSVPSFP